MTTLVKVEENAEEFFAWAYKQGWTDGLPVIPPTPERVRAMMSAVDLDPDSVVARLEPRRGAATVEKLAANAVMAGCLPEYFPVVLAAVEGITSDDFCLTSVNTTTNQVALLTVVNGPIRHEIDVNCGWGVFGPGWRANATIGRALRLIQINVCGSIPGEVSKSTHGSPGRYTMCIGEWEEKSPWEPLHVELGMPADTSCVTMFQPSGTVPAVINRGHDNGTTRGATLLYSIAHCVDNVSTPNMLPDHPGDSLLVFCPDHANLLARDGYRKRDVQEELFELTRRIPIDRWPREQHAKMEKGGRMKNGFVSLHEDPSNFRIIVAGGLGGLHTTWLPTLAHAFSKAVPIRRKSGR